MMTTDHGARLQVGDVLVRDTDAFDDENFAIIVLSASSTAWRWKECIDILYWTGDVQPRSQGSLDCNYTPANEVEP